MNSTSFTFPLLFANFLKSYIICSAVVAKLHQYRHHGELITCFKSGIFIFYQTSADILVIYSYYVRGRYQKKQTYSRSYHRMQSFSQYKSGKIGEMKKPLQDVQTFHYVIILISFSSVEQLIHWTFPRYAQSLNTRSIYEHCGFITGVYSTLSWISLSTEIESEKLKT